MKSGKGRLILILFIALWLLAAGCSGAFAALKLSSSPTAATANSVWNIAATWQQEDGIWPTLESGSRTEGLINLGLTGTRWGATIGTSRTLIPAAWADSLTWWPAMAPPDGYVGFAEPAAVLPEEAFQPIGFVSVQPSPVDVPINPEGTGNPAYEHGLDYESLETISATQPEVPVPGAGGVVPACIVPQKDEVQGGDGAASRPATPAVIVTSKVPVMLVGVWSSASRSAASRLKARIRNAAEIFPKDDDNAGWPSYNVIEIMEKDGKLPAAVNRVYVSYYAPGTNYVITESSPLPMPYTVYRVTLSDTNTPYLLINPEILKLDPNRNGNLNDKNLQPKDCPVLGIYSSERDVLNGTNYFDLADPLDDPANPLAPLRPRYVAPSPDNPYGRLYFTHLPPLTQLRAGREFYVVVSSNAVDGVYTHANKSGTNYYLGNGNKPIGYCSKSGIIRLATPLPEDSLEIDADAKRVITGAQVFVEYRRLSKNTFTVAQSTKVEIVTNVTIAPSDPAWAFSSKDANCGYDGGKFVIDTKELPYPTFAGGITYWGRYPGGNVVWLGGNVPMRHHENGPSEGAIFRVAVSAGMNMSNPSQQPFNETALNRPDLNNRLIYDPRSHPMYYDGHLVAGPSGVPATRWLTAVGRCVKERAIVIYEVKTSDNVTVTVHDSEYGGMIDHGGVSGNRDWLSIISDAARPSYTDVDPLSIEPLNDEVNSSRPDDGSSSTQFVFRVRYRNRDGLQPLPWLHEANDYWNLWGTGSNSGVVLYLDQNGTGDYRPHFMQRENPTEPSAAGGGGDVYIYRIIPHNTIGISGSQLGLKWPFQARTMMRPDGTYDDNELYQSLACGTYHYFFACSDDSLKFENGRFPFEYQNSRKMKPGDPLSKTGLQEWGQTGGYYSSTGLDPSAQRVVTNYPDVDRAKYRRYSSSGTTPYDSTIYVDRPVRAPGKFEAGRDYPYQYACDEHPRVSCELLMPSFDAMDVRYDDAKYGWGRFFGTLSPYRFAVNPLLPGSRGGGTVAQRAETSGSFSKDTNVFRILYKQIDNKPPISIQLWVNNASEKSGDTPQHTYKAYSMLPTPGQTVKDYRIGVWYEYTLQSGTANLPAGPHTYYFTAYDGEHKVRWPVRPDKFEYDNRGIFDWWHPTESLASDYAAEDYYDNDFAPGPYVNSAPKITNLSVTPSTGKEGTNFVFRATYSDADGQRVHSAKLVIEVNAAGDKRTFDMYVDPKYKLNPTADNSELYKTGVDYLLDTASLGNLALETGTRRFYVEFTDDWGRSDDPNDRRKGETTRAPEGWKSGPVISGNVAPTLSKGSVTSADGTANAATLWTFKVNYRDKDNDPPAMVKLFIGRLQVGDKTVPDSASKVKNVIWDAGNTMVPSDPSDTVYSDGADYYFQTRLGAPDAAVLERGNVTMNDTLNVTPVGVPSKDIAAVYGVFMEGDPTNTNFYAGTAKPFVSGDLSIRLGKALPNPPTGQVYMTYMPTSSAIQYYYAFTAHDGSQYATYASSSNDDLRSDAAGSFVLQDADRIDETHYVIRPLIAKQLVLADATNTIDPDPNRIGDIITILGLYTNENLTGTNYVTTPINYAGSTDAVTLGSTVPAGKVWLKVEADTPIIGPLAIEYPEPVGMLRDAEVFQNFATNPTPLLLTDQKNGFVSDVENPDGSFDHAVLLMDGVGMYEGRPSGRYVTPASPEDIASVEGVYWLDNPDQDHKYDNYYDPSLLDPPVVREGGVIVGPGAAPDKVVVMDPAEVFAVLGVYDNPEGLGVNYYQGVGFSENANKDVYQWQQAYVLDTSYVWPVNPMDIVSIKGVYRSMTATPAENLLQPDADGFPNTYNLLAHSGVDGEPVKLDAPLASDPLPSRLYIAYYPPGTPNELGQITLTRKLPEDVTTVYVKIWAKGFNPGDNHIKLTAKLPDVFTEATIVTRGQVKPSEAGKLDEIGEVTGVYVEGDPLNYYTGTLNPFKMGDRSIYLGSQLPETISAPVTIAYQPKDRNVTIKYSDIRYTHLFTGTAQQPLLTDFDEPAINPRMTTGGDWFFVSDGRYVDSINILGNSLDPVSGLARPIDGGVVGVWTSPDLSGINYFNPRRVNVYDDDPPELRLSTKLPAGTGQLFARAYQKGMYFIDRWNRTLRFDANSPVQPLDKIQVSYFFGQRMPKKLLPNSLPKLTEGKVTPLVGARSTQYIYSVKYTDIDGPNGQMPEYVRVVIDGVAYDMTPISTGTPLYNVGAVYTYKPSGSLAGGSHSYHFVASDGAAFAWFDKNGAHQAERGLPTLSIVDLEGPWVNDPPQLSNGAAAPNPATGGISTKDSVDYTVTLRDADNDQPYFYDPQRDPLSGIPISGAPRLWVDAAVNDDQAPPVTGSIVALEADPLETSRKRVMVVKITDAEGNLVDPNWTTDQFAGKLMQITNGDTWSDISSSPYLRVYLIQSNTYNKLTIATENLETDQLIVPKDPVTGASRLAQFRINGLLMSKVNPTDQNYALGIDYKITVPKLVVGAHKYHFTARTRETKPQWLLAMDEYLNKNPYSEMVRFPSVLDLNGPTVVSTTPSGNQKPVLSRIGSSTIYRGPRQQYATVLSPTRVQPSNYTALLSVTGVHVNANADAHLATEHQVDYFDATSTPNPPATGDPVKLGKNLPALSINDEIIQHGTVSDLLTVIPDVSSAIATVSAVYVGKDPRLTGTAHLPASPNLNGDGSITMAASLPIGTTDVYIKYKPTTATIATTANGTDNVPIPNVNAVAYVVGVYTAADVGFTSNLVDVSGWAPGASTVPLWGTPIASGTNLVVKYVPWPPVYVDYFSPEPMTAKAPIHGIFVAGEPLTFKVNYKDADGDPPTYHDGVQGYVQVVFSDTGRTSQLVPMGTGSSYISGMPFGVTLTDVPEGTHPYHFEASDGYEVTKYYGSGTSANPERVQVNYKPTLTNGSVDHTSGAASFTFTVKYTDRDNVAPAAGGFVKVILKHRTDPSVMITVPMTTLDLTPNYSVGVLYTGTVDVAKPDGSVNLPPGAYNTIFIAHDGIQDADTLAGPTVTRRDTNTAPVILNYEVRRLMPNGQLGPGTGKISDTFVYRAWYMDEDNDEPVYIAANGARQTALSLVIDEGLPTQKILPMTTGVTLPDYTLPEGVEFQARTTGRTLGTGNHTYSIRATDGDLPAVPASGLVAVKAGPILMLPYFKLELMGRDGEAITDRSIVGQEVLITGKMYFPYTIATEQPSDINNITIQVTKPDATAVSLNASLNNIRKDNDTNPKNWIGDIVVTYGGFVDPALITGKSLTLTASGQWVLNASWPGDSLYDGAQTDAEFDGHNDQVRVAVSGPSRTVAVVDPRNPQNSEPLADMITPPMLIGDKNPGAVFGWDRALAMRVVRWDPRSGQYYSYGQMGAVPELQPGDAVWIKPKLGNSGAPGSGYPAAEPLGNVYTLSATALLTDRVAMSVYASHILGVYTNAQKTGTNYYVHSAAISPFRAGDGQISLTSFLPVGTTQVWVSYVGTQSSVDEGWIALDNPSVAKEMVGGDPRYYHSQYRLVKVAAQAYPLKTGAGGSPILNTETRLPLLKSSTVQLTTGWNQVGNIFFNWKTGAQLATPAPDEPPAPQSGVGKASSGAIDQWKVIPVQPALIGKVLGVYLTSSLTGTNYYQPGMATQPYRRGDSSIRLTEPLPASTSSVYVKYELYPREDVGIPWNDLRVTYLGQTKSLADAAVAGWILGYAWRYDPIQRQYVKVAEAAGSERVLKAWSGYWVRAYVNCQLEIDPNTSFNGVFTGATKSMAVGAMNSGEAVEMPPPAPE